MTASAIKQKIVLEAPAKVNLHLGIGALRDDGYHEAESVLHTIELCDILTVELREGTGLFLLDSTPVLDIPSEKNLVHRAICEYAAALGHPVCAPDEDLYIHIEKNIPSQAGLGGGSADAAAALFAAARLWKQNPLDPLCIAVGASLGADVPFFLHGGCARMLGRGDRLDDKLDPYKVPLVLVKPAKGVSTKAAYQAFDANPCTPQKSAFCPEAFLGTGAPGDKAQAKDAAQFLGDALYNNLEQAAFSLLPELADHARWLAMQRGVQGSLLCGSGSALFAICESDDAARSIAAAAVDDRGLWACATRTRPTGVAVIGA